MNDIRPIASDTAFIFLSNVRGMPADQLTALLDYWIAVHRHDYGPLGRIEIVSGKLTNKQRTVILDHAAKLGLPVDGFNDIKTGQLRRIAFPHPPRKSRSPP